jgi:hypothetical protein
VAPDGRYCHDQSNKLCKVFHYFAERLAVAPAKWKLEFNKDVIAGCH